MNRRTFLQTLVTTAATPILNQCGLYSSFPEDRTINDTPVTAGNVYFYQGTNEITSEELSTLSERVQHNFHNAGIEFKSVAITKEFPALERLDFVMLCIKFSRVYPHAFPVKGCFGNRFCFNYKPFRDLTIENNYNNIKSYFYIPYDEPLATANMGIINLDFLQKKYRKENLEELAFVTNHELGHSLGAAHIFAKECANSPILEILRDKNCQTTSPYFMIRGEPDNYHQFMKTASFNPENIFAMKRFIREIQSDSKYDLPQNRIILRDKYLSKSKFI